MKSNGFLRGFATLSACLALATAAAATTPLTLTNVPYQSDTPINWKFQATAPTTTVSIGGYQPPSYLLATDNRVTLGGDSKNLLGGYWDFTRAAAGTYALSFNDGTAVPGLLFGGLTAGVYDTFSQAVTTTPGEFYELSFLLSNNPGGGPYGSKPNGLIVGAVAGGDPTTRFGYSGSLSIQASVPEPATWALLLLGFMGCGLATRRQGRLRRGACR